MVQRLWMLARTKCAAGVPSSSRRTMRFLRNMLCVWRYLTFSKVDMLYVPIRKHTFILNIIRIIWSVNMFASRFLSCSYVAWCLSSSAGVARSARRLPERQVPQQRGIPRCQRVEATDKTRCLLREVPYGVWLGHDVICARVSADHFFCFLNSNLFVISWWWKLM
jgi:hypothetical protein